MRRIAILGLLAVALAPPLRAQGSEFRTCAEARAAGLSDIPRGGHGYGPHLDRDGDGIACES